MSAKPSDSNDPRLSADRLLNAAMLALTEELDGMLEQFRGTVEAEGNVRLNKALLDKEVEFKTRLEEEQKRVSVETTEKVKSEVTAELEARFAETLERETAALTERFSGEAESSEAKWKEEKTRLAEESSRWRVLAEYQQKIGEASSQLEILRRFLKTAVRFADSSAVYLNKEDGLALWNSEGEEEVFPDVVSKDTIDPEWYFSLVVVRGKTVGAIGAAGPSDRDALVMMAEALNRAVENFGMRLRFLAGADNDISGTAPEEQAAAAPPPAREADPRQVARTIISEIKLGHEKQVLEGRVNSDLYHRLQKEIEEGRGAYTQQLSSQPDQDYFHEEILKILADNILSRLGADYPGPVEQT